MASQLSQASAPFLGDNLQSEAIGIIRKSHFIFEPTPVLVPD